jgi:DNA-binding transcriptional regulator YdaS (Cro superfamily)
MAKPKKTGIEKAVEIAGLRPLGRQCGISVSVIQRMKERGIVLPHHCLPIHKATGVPLHELNPLIYPKAA